MNTMNKYNGKSYIRKTSPVAHGVEVKPNIGRETPRLLKEKNRPKLGEKSNVNRSRKKQQGKRRGGGKLQGEKRR